MQNRQWCIHCRYFYSGSLKTQFTSHKYNAIWVTGGLKSLCPFLIKFKVFRLTLQTLSKISKRHTWNSSGSKCCWHTLWGPLHVFCVKIAQIYGRWTAAVTIEKMRPSTVFSDSWKSFCSSQNTFLVFFSSRRSLCASRCYLRAARRRLRAVWRWNMRSEVYSSCFCSLITSCFSMRSPRVFQYCAFWCFFYFKPFKGLVSRKLDISFFLQAWTGKV